MPFLPKKLQYLNYSNNLIQIDSLTIPFKRLSCDDLMQNCLPYEFMDWKILNATIKDTLFNIVGMTIKLNSDYGWNGGSQVETVNYLVKNSKLVANKTIINRFYDNVVPPRKDIVYSNRTKYSVDVSTIHQLLKDIYSNKMLVQIQVNDSIISINLNNKKNSINCSSSCSHCIEYDLQYLIYSHTDTIKLSYNSESFINGLLICYPPDEPQNIKSILEWLYIYKLLHLTFYKHEIVQNYFKREDLEKLAQWVNKN